MGVAATADMSIESVTWAAKVIRADGTIEDLGIIAEYQRPRTGFWTRPRARALRSFYEQLS